MLQQLCLYTPVRKVMPQRVLTVLYGTLYEENFVKVNVRLGCLFVFIVSHRFSTVPSIYFFLSFFLSFSFPWSDLSFVQHFFFSFFFLLSSSFFLLLLK